MKWLHFIIVYQGRLLSGIYYLCLNGHIFAMSQNEVEAPSVYI